MKIEKMCGNLLQMNPLLITNTYPYVCMEQPVVSFATGGNA